MILENSRQKNSRKYYEAYEERYKAAHEKGVSWEHMKSTPIVLDILRKYNLHQKQLLLEVGCGSKETTLKFYEGAGYNSSDKTAFFQWLD